MDEDGSNMWFSFEKCAFPELRRMADRFGCFCIFTKICTLAAATAYYQTRCESFDGVYISFSCNNMKMRLRVTKKYMAAYLVVPLYLIVTL